ncbi:NAD-dependent epimerase/dehydratase family protein [Oenococcus sp.]|uniref:NAD-dependent epimerase/dehydratase family protein n=1 Tax=Oenococcus sp. TaxID=1979414 RepID=UPI0039E89E86
MTNNLQMNPILKQDILELISKNKDLFADFQGRTVLISGATGLVGSYLSKTFALYNLQFKGNIKILCLIRDYEKAKKIFGPLYNSFSFIQHDIRDSIQVNQSIDYIFHTASVTASDNIIHFPIETLDTLYLGTKNLLELAKQKHAQFLYFSSMEAYGITDPSLKVIHESDLGYVNLNNVRSIYPEGKRACELLTSAYAKEYGMQTYNVRLAQTFGAGTAFNETRIFADFAHKALKGEPLVIQSTGKTVGNYVDTRDVVTGALSILSKGIIGETYNLANEELSMTIYDMSKLVSQVLSGGKSRVIIMNDVNFSKKFPPDTMMRLDSTKLRRIGWAPTGSFENMLKKMVSSWQFNDLGQEIHED